MANEEILELQIRDNASDAASSLANLSEAFTKVKNAVGKGLDLKNTVKNLEKLKTAVTNGIDDASITRFERLAAVLERLKNVGSLKLDGVKSAAKNLNMSDAFHGAKDSAQGAMDGVDDVVDRGFEDIEERVDVADQSMSGSLEGVKERLLEVWNALNDVDEQSGKSAGTKFFDDLKTNAETLRQSLKKIIGDFARIVKYRMIRSIIKNITKGFSEGVQNVYKYSSAIGGSLAPAMDDAASVLLQFKNSIGAAAAPMIEMLIPYMKQLVNATIEVVNWINQFLALLNGQSTWTEAIYKNTEAFDDQTKKAKKSGKAMKELLADWDELNIIQSESGGSGSGTSKAVEDYTQMFRENSKFSDFIEDHFEGILSLIKKIGALLLTWKFSKMFEGFLGNLFKLAAGGILVSIGLQLGYGAGFDAGANGGWDARTIIQAIVGSVATALGGYIIATTLGFSGGVGFAIGLGVGVIVTLYGYNAGLADYVDKMKWGDLEWSKEQIQRFVEGEFRFDVRPEITLLNGVVTNNDEAKKQLDQSIIDFKNSLTDAKIEASINIESDETSTAITDAADKAREAITSINNLIKTSGEGLDIVFKSFTFKNDAGEDISEDILANIKISDETVSDYFKGIGDELASLIEQGESEHWKNSDTKKAALELMEREQKILDEAKRLKADMNLSVSIASGFSGGMSRDTAGAILEEQKAALAEYETAAKEAIQSEADNYVELAALAEAASRDAFERGDKANGEALHKAAEDYKTQATTLLDGMDDAISGKLEETRKYMAQEWAKTLSVVYGEDFGKDFKDKRFGAKYLDQKSYFQRGDVRGVAKEYRDYIVRILTNDDPNGIVDYVLNDLNGNVFDLLDDGMKESIVKNLMELTGDNQGRVKELLKEAFDLSNETIDELINIHFEVNAEYDDIKKAIENSGVNEKSKYMKAVDEMLSSGDVESIRNLKDMINKYGIKQALDALDNYLNGNGFTFGQANGTRRLASASGLRTTGGGIATMPEGFNYKSNTVNASGSDQSNEQMTTNIANGMKKANEPQNELLNQLIRIATQINNKEFTLNVRPNSTWGQFGAASGRAYSRVTGEG